ncbi:hypothetical protein AB0M95_40165 [Sphaerisporangium sp. NPDC051017]|uniref:hypothetical protein n=1 Tax=Sphaerisporangium sp. NPDC051017 TaxID=3154636 RepID=UPI0034373132
MTLTVPTTNHLKFRVTLEETLDTKIVVWGADPTAAPIRSGVSARTLAELFEEVEAVKHFILDLPTDVPISVEYVYEIPRVPHHDLGATTDRLHPKSAFRNGVDRTLSKSNPSSSRHFSRLNDQTRRSPR